MYSDACLVTMLVTRDFCQDRLAGSSSELCP